MTVERASAQDQAAPNHLAPFDPVRFGVIGAGSRVANAAVLPAIVASRGARLVAAGSIRGDVPARWADVAVDGYEAVLEHPDVEAVYIPLPNHLHRHWAERAAAAGKHVLCEKPLAPTADDARAMAEAATSAGVLLAEAWMTPFDRRWSSMQEMARSGSVGHVTRIENRFTFAIGPAHPDDHRWRADQGGGALLDVGIYCVGTAVELWGVDCTVDNAVIVRSESGVDVTTTADLRWSGGPAGDRIAHVHCSIVDDDEMQRAEFIGTTGRLSLDAAAYTAGHERDHLITRTTHDDDGRSSTEHLVVEPGNSYAEMVEAFCRAVRGTELWPRPVERSIELISLLDQIRDADHD